MGTNPLVSERPAPGGRFGVSDGLYLVDLRCSGIRPHIDHVDPGGDERRQNQAVSFLGGVTEAAAAGVPARVMELIVKVRHRQPVDDLQEVKVQNRSE